MLDKIKRNILFIVLGLIILLLVLFLWLIRSTPSTTSLKPYNKPYQVLTNQDREQLNQEDIVSQLLTKLPYHGKYFSFKYDFSTFTYVLTIDKSNHPQGEEEFDKFLLINSVLSRSWFKRLEIRYQ